MSKDSQKLKIAVTTEVFLPKIDGIVSILQLMLRRLNELGHEVLLFAPDGAPPEYECARVVGVKGPTMPLYPEMKLLIPTPMIGRNIKAFDPDIIHVVNPGFLGPYGIYYARRHHVPLLASFHTNVPQYMTHYGYGFTAPALWAYFRGLHNRAELNLGTSSFMRDELTGRGFKNVHWWKRGIDTEFFSPGACDPDVRAQFTDGNPDDFLVVYVGRHAPEKGLFELRDAIFPMDGVRLALVGGGPSHEDLKKHFADTPTTFPGYMRGEDLQNAYRVADAFIFPSTTETFGLVALEAMAVGLPVIAARAGGIVDTVIHEENGLFFEPGHPEQIREHVLRLRDDITFRRQLSENALNHALSRSWRATMDQLVDYYYETIDLAHKKGRVKTVL